MCVCQYIIRQLLNITSPCLATESAAHRVLRNILISKVMKHTVWLREHSKTTWTSKGGGGVVEMSTLLHKSY